jgi:glycosyltransferase involved in cell wall biosynthesis
MPTAPIKVLKFINHFFIGGTERQFVHVANGLDRSRFEVEIACLRREGPLLECVGPDMQVHTYSANGSFYHYRSIMNQLRFARDMRARNMDVVHSYGWYPSIFAIPPSWLARSSAIITSVRDAGAYMTPAKIRALKVTCRLADCVLANSMAGRTWLIEQGINETKIEVIPNGIRIPPSAERENRGRIRNEFGIAAGTPVCACLGRVVSGKGIDFYLRAARILVDQGRDVRFLMIGAMSAERNYKSEMELLARELNLDGKVVFTGQRQDISEILRDVDVVVHPSLTEGLSNVILEAMAAGLPVVATTAGGNPELVEHGRTGLLVPPASAAELALAIACLLDNPAMGRAFGERARQRVMDEFAMDRMLRKTEDLYLRLVRQKNYQRGKIQKGKSMSD